MTLFGKDGVNESFEQLTRELDGRLSSLGFHMKKRGEWHRVAAWKREEIDLKRKGPDLEFILPSFGVLLPRAELNEYGETNQYIAYINVSRFLHPNDGPNFDQKIPSLPFLRRGFIQNVKAEIEEALPWFNQFATPTTVEENLHKLIKPGSPSFVDAMKVLEKIRADKDKTPKSDCRHE